MGKVLIFRFTKKKKKVLIFSRGLTPNSQICLYTLHGPKRVLPYDYYYPMGLICWANFLGSVQPKKQNSEKKQKDPNNIPSIIFNSPQRFLVANSLPLQFLSLLEIDSQLLIGRIFNFLGFERGQFVFFFFPSFLTHTDLFFLSWKHVPVGLLWGLSWDSGCWFTQIWYKIRILDSVTAIFQLSTIWVLRTGSKVVCFL